MLSDEAKYIKKVGDGKRSHKRGQVSRSQNGGANLQSSEMVSHSIITRRFIIIFNLIIFCMNLSPSLSPSTFLSIILSCTDLNIFAQGISSFSTRLLLTHMNVALLNVFRNLPSVIFRLFAHSSFRSVQF